MSVEDPTAAGRAGAAIIEAIAARRGDAEFMARLADRLEHDAHILDRLADEPPVDRDGKVCPTCGHAVQVVGDTTQHYEPVGCWQLVDDHEFCISEMDRLRAALTAARAELDRHGYGDFHYNEPGYRDPEVLAALAAIDAALEYARES